MPPITVTVPQLGVNDLKALIVEWLIPDGGNVGPGEFICVLETTKTTFEVQAEAAGFLCHLAALGTEVSVSQPIALIGADRETLEVARKEIAARVQGRADKPASAGALTGALRATEKARALAAQLGINLSLVPGDGVLRESDVLRYQQTLQGEQRAGRDAGELPKWGANRKPVLIYGAGRGGETVRECLALHDAYETVGFVDDNPAISLAAGSLPVYRAQDLAKLREHGVGFVALAIASGDVRLRILEQCVRIGMEAINVIHPTAFIAPSVRLGRGNFIKARAIIETACQIGDGCIIDNGAVIAHDNLLEDGCHIAPGVAMGSSIRVGRGTIVGIGASLATKLTVGKYCIIAVGSSVTRDVPDYAIIEGVPGRIVGSRKAGSP